MQSFKHFHYEIILSKKRLDFSTTIFIKKTSKNAPTFSRFKNIKLLRKNSLNSITKSPHKKSANRILKKNKQIGKALHFTTTCLTSNRHFYIQFFKILLQSFTLQISVADPDLDPAPDPNPFTGVRNFFSSCVIFSVRIREDG